MAMKPRPEGYHSVTTYLVVPRAAEVMEFLKRALGAAELFRMEAPGGKIAHAELRIGDSPIMLADASDEWKPMPAMLYVYADEEVDAVYRRALDHGAVSVKPPEDQFYGDRNATVRDLAGNLWSIANHVEDVPPGELERRAAAAHKG
jgi:uncharacterized glyoxalase superfamily protein PhnB